MAGINSLLNIGRSALNASQVAISITGSNISNVDTNGYSTQKVNLSNNPTTGGVDIDGVTRSYDAFVEAQYLDKIATRDRWQVLYKGLSGVENLFNESNTKGVSSCLSTFFSDWSNLTSSTASNASITAMLQGTDTLLSLLQSTSDSLKAMRRDYESAIRDDVNTLNDLATRIAAINTKIDTSTSGTRQYNDLLDTRDALIEQMAGLVDVKVIDRGGGDLAVFLTSGQTVVDGSTSFTFSYEAGQTVRQLSSTSIAAHSDAQCYYSGADASEYTIQVVDSGNVGSGATFKVSLDGGKTWLTDDAGNVLTYAADSESGKVTVGDLDIWFGTTSNASSLPSTALNAGDTFTLVPKKALYWHTTAGTPENISPQQFADGTDNARRLTGGALCGALTLLDTYIGDYQDSLDAFTESLIWEINRLYSQGSGKSAYASILGTYAVDATGVPLGESASGLPFSNRLSSGASMLYVYDASGKLASSGAIDFSSVHASNANFNPATDSLEDVVTAINNSFDGHLNAEIVDGKLRVTADAGYTFRFGDDSSGLFAGLGLNTLLTGSGVDDVGINSVMKDDNGKVCIGSVAMDGSVSSGDTATAQAIAALADSEVKFTINGRTVSTQTLSDYYNTLVGSVGSATAAAKYQYKYQGTLANSLQDEKLAVSAVSLDEELTKLIQFQYAYQAAAKLISTADTLFSIVLGMK